jgi:hypothetical protein
VRVPLNRRGKPLYQEWHRVTLCKSSEYATLISHFITLMFLQNARVAYYVALGNKERDLTASYTMYRQEAMAKLQSQSPGLSLTEAEEKKLKATALRAWKRRTDLLEEEKSRASVVSTWQTGFVLCGRLIKTTYQ